jgi:hypothetical protein
VKRLRFLFDVRRWRAVWGALTDDAVLLLSMRDESDRVRDLVVAVAPDDAWPAMAELAEHRLPEAIRDGMFSGIDRWLNDEIPAAPEPDPEQRIDRRRFAAMRDAFTAEAFLGVAVWPDGDRSTTVVVDSQLDRGAVFSAVARVAAAIERGDLDQVDGRLEWADTDGAGDAP